MSITLGYAPQKALLEWEQKAEIRTIPQLFDRSVKLGPQKVMLAAKKDGRYQGQTWQEVSDKVESLSCALMALGLGPEDRVAQLSGNRPEWVIADLAILSAGGVHVPIYPTLVAKDIGYLLHDCGARIIL